MDVKDIRHENLLGLIRAEEGRIARLARKTDLDASYLSQLKNRTRDMGDEFARAMEAALSKPRGWMDQRHFVSEEDAMTALEMDQIRAGLSPEDLEAWMRHGRLLMKNQPKGPNNPFGKTGGGGTQ